MWKYIIDDLQMATRNYLRIGIIIGLIVVSISAIFSRLQSKTINKKKLTSIFFFAIYIVAVFEIAFFSRESGSRNSVDLQLLSTWGKDALSRAYVVENVIMFLPFGFITPYIWRYMQRFWVCISFGILMSISIELLQLITKRGYCQLDDVIMNVLGATLGHGVYRNKIYTVNCELTITDSAINFLLTAHDGHSHHQPSMKMFDWHIF